MAKRWVELPDKLDAKLAEAARRCGLTEDDIVEAALCLFFSSEEPAEALTPEEREKIIEETAGIWKDRTDLPDFAALRKEWDERMERLFGKGWEERIHDDPAEQPKKPREPGSGKGMIIMGPDFDDPLEEFEEYQ